LDSTSKLQYSDTEDLTIKLNENTLMIEEIACDSQSREEIVLRENNRVKELSQMLIPYQEQIGDSDKLIDQFDIFLKNLLNKLDTHLPDQNRILAKLLTMLDPQKKKVNCNNDNNNNKFSMIITQNSENIKMIDSLVVKSEQKKHETENQVLRFKQVLIQLSSEALTTNFRNFHQYISQLIIKEQRQGLFEIMTSTSKANASCLVLPWVHEDKFAILLLPHEKKSILVCSALLTLKDLAKQDAAVKGIIKDILQNGVSTFPIDIQDLVKRNYPKIFQSPFLLGDDEINNLTAMGFSLMTLEIFSHILRNANTQDWLSRLNPTNRGNTKINVTSMAYLKSIEIAKLLFFQEFKD